MEMRIASQEEVDAAQAGQPPLMRLAFDMQACATNEEMVTNLEATLLRGYISINDLLGACSGTVSLVGSGPSIKSTVHELVGDVFAINQSVGWLLEQKIVPKYAMFWDAAEIVAKFAVPHPDITYLVASRCHPAVFERLAGCNVMVWHAGGDHDINDQLFKRNILDEPMIPGGSAGITRAICFANVLGYRDIHIFGGDSSYGDDGNTHIVGSLVPEKDIMVSVGSNPPRWFRTTPEWCAQVNEYLAIYATLAQSPLNKIEVHGTGMLPYMHEVLVMLRANMGEAEFIKGAVERHKEQTERDTAASAIT